MLHKKITSYSQISEVFDEILEASRRECIICKKNPAEGASIFFAANGDEFGVEEGYQAMIIYPICTECADNPENYPTVETMLRVQALSERN